MCEWPEAKGSNARTTAQPARTCVSPTVVILIHININQRWLHTVVAHGDAPSPARLAARSIHSCTHHMRDARVLLQRKQITTTKNVADMDHSPPHAIKRHNLPKLMSQSYGFSPFRYARHRRFAGRRSPPARVRVAVERKFMMHTVHPHHLQRDHCE